MESALSLAGERPFHNKDMQGVCVCVGYDPSHTRFEAKRRRANKKKETQRTSLDKSSQLVIRFLF